MSDVLTPDVLWPISFFVFFGVCVLMFVSIVIKTHWWKTSTGWNMFLLSGWFVFVMTLGVLGMLGVLPDWLRAWSRFAIYSTGSVILFWRVVVMWVWNKGFWAWSKTERTK